MIKPVKINQGLEFIQYQREALVQGAEVRKNPTLNLIINLAFYEEQFAIETYFMGSLLTLKH